MKFTLRKCCMILGVCLLAAAVAWVVIWQVSIHTAKRQAQSYVNTLQAVMPTPEGAIPEARRDNAMAVLPVDGMDFVGILEMPKYDSVLPVGAAWGNSSKFPCRFGGSVYDHTMQIGATTQAGQYDFYREISVGDSVFFTDMEGNRYTYQVTDIRYEKHMDGSVLQRENTPLTLFIKNIYAFEYIVVYCDVLQ